MTPYPARSIYCRRLATESVMREDNILYFPPTYRTKLYAFRDTGSPVLTRAVAAGTQNEARMAQEVPARVNLRRRPPLTGMRQESTHWPEVLHSHPATVYNLDVPHCTRASRLSVLRADAVARLVALTLRDFLQAATDTIPVNARCVTLFIHRTKSPAASQHNAYRARHMPRSMCRRAGGLRRGLQLQSLRLRSCCLERSSVPHCKQRLSSLIRRQTGLVIAA